MTSLTDMPTTCLLTTAYMLYEAVDGSLFLPTLLPAAGFALLKTGEYFKSPTIEAIGAQCLVATIITAPGALIGRAISSYWNFSSAVKTAAYTLGIGLTYKLYNIAEETHKATINSKTST